MIKRLGSALFLLATLCLCGSALAQRGGSGANPGTRNTYCCNDDSGKQVCSDVLPPQCYGKAYREISPTGRTVKRIDAPLTAEQRTVKEAEAKKAKEEELRRKEEDRRNRALLATYATEKDIDYARDRALADIAKTIQASEEKLAELGKQQQKLDGEAEFYKKKTPPPALQAQIRDNQAEMKTQQAAIAAKQKEIETVKARYEAERQRYRELTASKTTAPSAADSRPR
ncbi:MAG: hypothetical protein JNL78_07025 [Rhodocyclaceae bacterium]|jgi:chromosome segregation ATPase|nr:hypothetical protein [Rhodocyclaceae bacterium]